MEWLNLKTSVLHAPEYIGSSPTSRATWMNVSLWSAHQENGGRIVGARSWGNRQWQQTCGVTRREIHAAAKLLTWEADDLIVWNYPVEKEAEVQLNRTTGRNGGGSVSEAKRQAARLNGMKGGRPPKPNGETQEPNGNPTETQQTQAETQRNGKEGKGKEEEAVRARGALPDSLNTPQFRERWIRWQSHWSSTFHHGNPMPEQTAFQQLRDLVSMGEERAILAINNSLAKGNLRVPAEPYPLRETVRQETIVTRI